MDPLICLAIRIRRVLRFDYQGRPREVEPHCIGRTSEGHMLLHAFQVGGRSSSGRPHGWRMFRLDEASRFALADRSFDGPRPGYDPRNTSITFIECEL